MTPEQYGLMALEVERQQGRIMKNLLSIIRSGPKKGGRQPREWRRQQLLCEHISEHLAFHRVFRDGGKARWFSTCELGIALAEAGVLELRPVRQTWSALKVKFGKKIKVN